MIIVPTSDGNPTLYSEQFKSHYHSLNGSLEESKHIFIEHNLQHYINANSLPEINVFELGFGTGLNAYLTADFAQEHQVKIYYHTVELYPVPMDIISELHFQIPDSILYHSLHHADWNKETAITSHFKLYKQQADFTHISLPENRYHIFYMDAFGPDHHPEMWQRNILEKIYHSMQNKGCMTTFSARGSFRRDLQSLGFSVERLPGPAGKRHITRAVKGIL